MRYIIILLSIIIYTNWGYGLILIIGYRILALFTA